MMREGKKEQGMGMGRMLVDETLGLEPFVLIKIRASEGERDDFDVELVSGGGIDDDDIAPLLLATVEAITGVPADRYARMIDETMGRTT